MKTLFAALLTLMMASGTALADSGKRCGPTGQFMGYGFRVHTMPCWALQAFGGADATAVNSNE